MSESQSVSRSRLELARDEVDRVFGAGHAAAHPELVVAIVHAASSDWAARVICAALEELPARWSRASRCPATPGWWRHGARWCGREKHAGRPKQNGAGADPIFPCQWRHDCGTLWTIATSCILGSDGIACASAAGRIRCRSSPYLQHQEPNFPVPQGRRNRQGRHEPKNETCGEDAERSSESTH
jgi:hypothetical protein